MFITYCSTDNVTLRNSKGNVVSTSGVLKNVGSATNTYQLKDDHVTYAYAFPTPGYQNFAPAPSSSPSTVKSVKPTSNPTVKVTPTPTANPSTKVTSQPVVKVTSTPSSNPSFKKTSLPTSKPTVIPFNLIITELADPTDKAGARYIELYSNNGAGKTINNPYLYLIRWTNANAGMILVTTLL